MGIFDRMGKVISSNINSLLDRAEDPKKSLDLTVSEMTQSLREAKAEIIEALGTQKVLEKKVRQLDDEVDKWERRAELALKSGDEELAREALKQKKRIVADRDRGEATRAEQRGRVLSMKREMERMESKLEELKARKSTIAQEIERARKDDPETLGSPGKEVGGSAFENFRKMEAKIEQSRAEADAHQEINALLDEDKISEADLEAKFAALEGRGAAAGKKGTTDMDDEIARLKKKLRIDG